MPRPSVQAIVLAAGKSSRFKSETSKLLFTLCGQEMILYPLKTLQDLGIPTTLVIGYKKEQVKLLLENHLFEALSYAEQHQQLGTGDAVASTIATWYHDHILVLNGDMPLVQPSLVQELIDKHTATDAAVTFIIAHNDDASFSGYGRLVTQDGITKIVEARDFQGDPHQACFINAGIYIFRKDFLKRYITSLKKHDNSQELYLTDLIEIASANKQTVSTVTAPFDVVRGVNTLKELWAAEQIKRSMIIEHWMAQGVRFAYAQSTHIDVDVTIGAGTCIGAGAQILSGTRIGKNTQVGPYACIKNSIIGDAVTIQSHSVITDATIREGCTVGPFANVHHSIVGAKSVVGNFVEVNKSSIANNTKVKHLSYIGNAEIGSDVNIGAGTVICNYNGVTKNTTVIENNVFIGSNNALIAPVTIAHHSMTAAGSVITESVPPHALAIARAQQVNKEGYAHKLRGSISVKAATKTKDSNASE